MKSSNIITAKQWRSGHPEFLGSLPSDLAYARICTSLLKKTSQLFKQYQVPFDDIEDFALRLGHYVEDIVSSTHIFDSFRKIHEKMYGRKLPFYSLSSDYLENEVNIEDVKFIIWDHVQQIRGSEAIINPDNVAIDSIAEALFPLICDAYEEAPEVVELHDFIFDQDNYNNYIESKKVLMWLLITNPLTSDPDLLGQISDEMDALYDKADLPMDPALMFYTISSLHLFNTPCKWLSLYVHEMLAQMLETEGMKTEADKIKGTRHTGMRNFARLAKDGKTMLLSDTLTGETYRVITESFAESVETDRKYLTTDLASFDGKEWEINGSSWFSETPTDKPDTVRDGDLAFKHYQKALNGRRMAYFKSFADMQDKIIGDVPLTVSDDIRSDLADTPIIVFVNTNGSLSISPTLAPTIPDPGNPYFTGIDKAQLMGAAFNQALASTEMVRYMYDQDWYKGIGLSSSISTERGQELFHNNFDFLLRYFRGAEYHTS